MMKKFNMMTPKSIAVLVALCALLLCLAGCSLNGGVLEQSTDEEYTYINPDETKAQTDAGITIDGVLDEAVYKNNNWLYLHNDDGGNNVDIAMTSYYGQKGMYFVYDVTESVPIYVNLSRASYMNSGIEMYFAPSTVTSLGQNSIFEVDLLPTGDMVFKKSDGKGKYVNVATTDDIMAYLGATTKGGQVNTESCYGYCLELFIPWDYMDWLGLDADAMKQSFVYVDPAHITSNNYNGTDSNLDRYWYFYAQQQGATFSNVFQYFRFDKNGVLGTVPVEVVSQKNCTIQSDPNAIPGVLTTITIKPDAGYALNSILVNGEEWIEKANFNEDGSVDLVIRPGEKGLRISAEAEDVSDGTKTLSGKVILKNLEADTLEGVLLTYTGPQGEKPVELDKDGNFLLSELEQGYYVLKAEKEGYISVNRGIFLNRDTKAEVALEFDMFFAQNGTSFILDGQNEGYVQKFGGTGYIMSNPTYNRFTYEMKIRYDEDLATEADTDAFKQQRTGMRILFSNEKYWYIDMLKEGDKYILQYAKHSNSIFNKWSTVCELDASQIAKYKSDEGISLKVVREGRFAAVYLDGKLLRVEKLDSQYTTCSAQLGMESWSANRGVMEIPYSISRVNKVYVPGSDFYRGGKWDITGQYDGYVTLPGGGDGGWLNFGEKTVDSDITLAVKDNPRIKDQPGGFRTVLKYTFDNEKTASFSVFYNESGQYVIQSMGDTVFGWKTHHVLTDEQIAKLTGDGIKLRVVRIGTEISCYLDGEEIVAGADLTKAKDGTDTGIKADMKASVAIRHYGDEGALFVLPYEKSDTHQYVKIACEKSDNGTVVTHKQNYLLGDTVILSGEGAQGWYCVGMTLDGQEVTLNWDGTYSFETTKTEYTAKGTFDKAVFAPNKNWGLLKQNQGLISLPEGGDGGWLDMLNTYKDIDLTLNLRDYIGNKTELRQVVKFTFENDQTLALSVTYADGEYKIQSMNDTLYGWAKHYSLSDEQIASYQDQDGLEFRLVRIGEEVSVYLDGEEVISGLDLTVNKKGEATGIQTDAPAKVSIRHYGNEDVLVEIPFSVTDQIDTVTVVCPEGEYGTVTTNKKNYLTGDRVVLTPVPKDGYYCTGMTVDGNAITANGQGVYEFTASKETHTVIGIFSNLIFKEDNKEWDTDAQNVGKLTIPNSDGDTGWLNSYRSDYQDLDFKVILRDLDNSADNYRAAVRLSFANDQYVTFTVTNDRANDDATTVYELQNMGGTMHNWGGADYTLTQQQVAAIQSAEGLEMRVVRSGDVADVYIGGVHAYEYDLSSGNVADQGAKIELRFYGNTGKTVEVPFTISEEISFVTVTDASSAAEGSVSVRSKNPLIGKKVTLKPNAKEGYYCGGMTVDGQSISANSDGTYSFVATKQAHTVKGIFYKLIFKDDNANWDVYHQHEGVLKTKVTGNTGYVSTVDNYNQFTIGIHDPNGSIEGYSVAGQFVFENGKIVNVQVTKWNDAYYIKSANSSSIFGGNQNYLKIAADNPLYAKITGDGIKLTAMRVGTRLILAVDDGQSVQRLTGLWRDGGSLDLTKDKDGNATGITAAMGAKVELCSWCKAKITLPFELKAESEAVSVEISAMTNGKVTTDSQVYLPGETVTLTVTGDAGYAHNSLIVNGKNVETDLYGKYSFVITQDTVISATFAPSVFKSTVTGWLLENQHYGQIAAEESSGHSAWADFADEYGDIDITLTTKEFESTNELARTLVRFTFTNGKILSVSVAKNKINGQYEYTVESIGGGSNLESAGYDYYTLTDAQIAKYTGEGIEFRVVRCGTKVYVYLDDAVVVDGYDLTKGGTTGITADTKMNVTIRQYDTPNTVAVFEDFLVKNTAPTVKVNIAAATNGTITADKSSYKLGETVTLTVTPDSGYVYNSLTVDGKDVKIDWKTGTYSFTANKEEYTVTGGFASSMFKENGEWNVSCQNDGYLVVPSSDGDAASLLTVANTFKEVDFRATIRDQKNSDDNFRFAVYLDFGDGKWQGFSLTNDESNTDPTTEYELQTLSGGSLLGWTVVDGWKLSDALVTKIQNQGVEFRLVRVAQYVDIYIDGQHVYEYDLTKDKDGNATNIGADTGCDVQIRYVGNKGLDIVLPFSLGDSVDTVALTIPDMENGTVTAEQNTYLPGDTVTLNVTADSGYAHNLKLNGSSILLDWDSDTYSFVAREGVAYSITGSFDKSKWVDGSGVIYKNQHVGVLGFNYATGNSGWIKNTGNYTKISMTVKDYVGLANSGASGKEFSFCGQFTFSDGKTAGARIINENGVYKIGLIWSPFVYEITDAAWIEKIQTTGATFELVLNGDQCEVWFEGTMVYTYTCTYDASSNPVTYVRFRSYGNYASEAYDVELPYELS